jgi:hypothetical protein
MDNITDHLIYLLQKSKRRHKKLKEKEIPEMDTAVEENFIHSLLDEKNEVEDINRDVPMDDLDAWLNL